MLRDIKVPHYDKRARFKAAHNFLFLFISLTQIAAITTVCVGIWLYVDLHVDYCTLFKPFYKSGHLLLASGAIALLLCWCGYVLLLKNSGNQKPEIRPFILIFVVFLTLMISAGISATVNNSNLKNGKFENILLNVFSKNNTDEYECLITIQKQFKCCGSKNFTEWFNQFELESIWQSCDCNHGNDNCMDLQINVTLNSLNIFSQTCITAVVEKLVSRMLFIRIYSGVFSALEVGLILFTTVMLYRMSGEAVVETDNYNTEMNEMKSKTNEEIFHTSI